PAGALGEQQLGPPGGVRSEEHQDGGWPAPLLRGGYSGKPADGGLPAGVRNRPEPCGEAVGGDPGKLAIGGVSMRVGHGQSAAGPPALCGPVSGGAPPDVAAEGDAAGAAGPGKSAGGFSRCPCAPAISYFKSFFAF